VKALLFAAFLTASCGAPLMKLPAGPGTPASDGASVIAQAMSACRAVNTITLEMSVSGKAAGHRLRGRLTAGLARPASARLEAVAPFGQPIFVFVANGDEASLLLPRDRRVLERGKAPDVLEAISGVPLDTATLRSLVTGCANAPDASAALALGEDWREVPDGGNLVYFRRDGAQGMWRIVSTTKRGVWRADYATFENGLPNAVHLVSQPAGRFDLQMQFSQIEVNVTLGPDAFRLQKTADAAPITLDELRASGPLGVK
jgi:hypothetical protein